ncbi:hypothetical protein POSPLADRAFT_1048309 [Postia placenta MAD-698-R-SB12]|uniref:Uncharacterized protein n=1 Tax=Postia placenta MAD-698-R-SB12 TaxID=670580 RepID=A0A1X6MUF2_9APHY|nr:hypothetical protein POSPLADRAFT_1048309 [Postia placenta MAD-698-R-SB12]OSX59842.1 hypothetical protein POSPLADRAFT_1048309 [Postia placenta MAD-698-R-SB12]
MNSSGAAPNHVGAACGSQYILLDFVVAQGYGCIQRLRTGPQGLDYPSFPTSGEETWGRLAATRTSITIISDPTEHVALDGEELSGTLNDKTIETCSAVRSESAARGGVSKSWQRHLGHWTCSTLPKCPISVSVAQVGLRFR